MRIGYVLPNSWGLPDPRDDVELAVLAEQLGAASLWVSHHVVHVDFVKERLGTGNYYDPLVSLAAAAMATSTVRLGTSVLVLGYLEPLTTAKQLATIDWLSHGRVDAGVGVGSLKPEFDVAGQMPFEDRGRYGDEFIEVLTRLWAPGPATFKGQFFTLDNAETYPGRYAPDSLRLLIGGNGGPATRRLIAHGDGWHGIAMPPDAVAAHIKMLTSRLEQAGRSADGFPMQIRLHVDADQLDAATWRDTARAYAQAGLTDLVLAPQTRDKDAQRRWLETLLPVLTSAAQTS
jgi:probable F420-dependent oxidoreductase